MRKYLAVDVGATNLRVGVVGDGGFLINEVRTNTPRQGGELAVAEKIGELVNDLMGGAPLSEEVEAAGVGTIGPLRISSGEVVDTPNNPLRNFKLLEPLRE
ncbi:MAG: ROK family protein, partial [Desulfurococcales archaeon]|nr:ROK family protein [Desulfurococcales archaeon]